MNTPVTHPALAHTACPTCETIGSLRLGQVLVARPLGSFSLAGAQAKVSAYWAPALSCGTEGCDFKEIAKPT